MTASDSQGLARQVLAIFEAKCADCHGAELPRPKGKFGYVLDLARVADNPDMIVRGEPDESELYQMVVTNEMPGEDSDIPPLTPEELDMVRRWIEIGAPAGNAGAEVPIPASGSVAHDVALVSPPPGASVEAVEQASPAPVRTLKQLTVGQRIIRVIGQFHPPSSHFPIAFLMAAAPAEVMWQRTRKPSWKAAVRFCVMLGALGAILTAGLGWCTAAFASYAGEAASVLPWHRWIGTATAIWAALTAVLSEFSHRDGRPRWLRFCFRFSLLIGVALVGVSGFLGASIIYGLRHYTW